MGELPQVAFKGKMLKSSSHLCAEYPFLALCWHSELERQMGVYYESRNPTFTGLPLPQKQPGPLPLPHGMGKWDANFPNSQNSNIARFISFSTLVALKREKGEKKAKLIKLGNGGGGVATNTFLVEVRNWFGHQGSGSGQLALQVVRRGRSRVAAGLRPEQGPSPLASGHSG